MDVYKHPLPKRTASFVEYHTLPISLITSSCVTCEIFLKDWFAIYGDQGSFRFSFEGCWHHEGFKNNWTNKRISNYFPSTLILLESIISQQAYRRTSTTCSHAMPSQPNHFMEIICKSHHTPTIKHAN